MLPHPSPPVNLVTMAIRAVLWPLFRPLCSALLQPVYSKSPSRVKRRKKGIVANLVEYIVAGQH
jgi:hypothetical protein